MPAEPADARRRGLSGVAGVSSPGGERLSMAVTLPEQAEMKRNRRLRNVERVDQFVCGMGPHTSCDAGVTIPAAVRR